MINKHLYDSYGFILKFLGTEKSIFRIIKKVNFNLKNKISILDVGCGTGVIGLSFMRTFPGSVLLSTDIDERFLKQTTCNAEKLGFRKPRVKTGLADISFPEKVKLAGKSIILKPKTFDVVCVGGSLGYSSNQKKTLKTLLSLIKPGGYFINLEENESVCGRLVSLSYDYHPIPLSEMKKTIEAEGFKAEFKRLSVKYFPACLTRILIMARKN